MWKTVLCLSAVLAMVGVAQAGILYSSQGFEAPLYTLGVLPGQDGWVSDSTGGQPDPIVINDPTGAGMGQVVELDATGTTAGVWTGAARAAGPSTLSTVVIEWDQYRVDTGDNFWYADSIAWDGWWAMQWDMNGQASAQQFDFGVSLTTGTWQHVIYMFDMAAQTVTVNIDGASYTSPNPMTDPAIDGIDLEVEPTPAVGDGPVLVDNLIIYDIPEPASLSLLALGAVALIRRRK